jgi:WD40 repeat protein
MHGNALDRAVDRGANTVAPEISARTEELGAFGVAARFSGDGGQLFSAAANGRLQLSPIDPAAKVTACMLDAMPLAVARFGTASFLVGTDAGQLLRITPNTEPRALVGRQEAWIEQLAVDRHSRRIAFAAGRAVVVLAGEGSELRRFESHPSTPTGLAFAPDGQALAVSHYDGVTVWDLEHGERIHALEWHGSHTRLTWSPDGRYIVTATQDNELHAWRMPEGRSLKMSGYPAKIRSLSWSADGAFLACAGADTVTCWSFAGDGPSGTAPIEFGYVYDSLVCEVAAHPREPVVAAGYDNGSVLIGTLATGEALIARPAGGGRVTSLDWSPDGEALAVATESGALTLLRIVPGVLDAG